MPGIPTFFDPTGKGRQHSSVIGRCPRQQTFRLLWRSSGDQVTTYIRSSTWEALVIDSIDSGHPPVAASPAPADESALPPAQCIASARPAARAASLSPATAVVSRSLPPQFRLRQQQRWHQPTRTRPRSAAVRRPGTVDRTKRRATTAACSGS